MKLRHTVQHSTAFSTHTNHKRQGFNTPLRARVTALFFCLIFVVSTIIPTYQTIASAATKTQQLPGALPVVESKQSPAADAATPKGEKASAAALSGEPLQGPQPKPSKSGSKHVEVASKRTLNTKTFDTGGGQFETRQYMGPVHFKNSEGKLQHIDTSLIPDTNAADSTNLLGEAISWVKSKTQDISTYKVKANDWQARFASSSDPVGMVRIEADGKKISFSPKGAAQDVTPVVSKTAEGIELVRYPNLWKDVDVIYSVKNSMLKEDIIIKSNKAETNFAFKLNGANLKKNKQGGFDVEGVKQSFSELSVTLQKSGPTSDKVITQDFKNGVLSISLDKAWLKKQTADQYPVVIDPTWTNGPTVSWNYVAYKSDGYVCSSSVCFMNAGQLYDNSWKNWRTVMCTGNMNFLAGKAIHYAGMYLQQANRSYLAGYAGQRIFWLQHAASFNYNGNDWGAPTAAAIIDYGGEIDVTSLVTFEANRQDWGPCWSLWGEVYGTYGSYKGFDPDISYMRYFYNAAPSAPTIISPQADQTFVDPQVSFQINPSTDADDPVSMLKYSYYISTGSGGSGTVIASGDTISTQWTVPDGVLQDGTTYYVRAYASDGINLSAASTEVKFKIDMRRGKDKTQTADTVGPVSIDLATGNVATSISSHDTTALGGNLGVSLDYNSPLRSRNGLVGRYWNVNSQNFVPDINNSAATLTRTDKNVNFSWDQESYSSGQNKDWYYGVWDGYFVAPVAGTYHFGASSDDYFAVFVKDKLLFDNTCYSSTPCYTSPSGSTAVNGTYLEAGEVAKIQVRYLEATGAAYAKLYVKGPVAEQVVPTEWLSTGPRPVQQNTGLQGRYYYDDGSHNIDSTSKQIFLSRSEPVMNFNWGTGSPIPGGPGDFMSRWEGYITVPKNATYRFKTLADDGTKLRINGQDLSPAGSWNKCCSETRFTDIPLDAEKPYYIVADHYDGGGPGSYTLYVETTDGSITNQVIPSSWLSPTKQVLPDGWQLGIDPDGDLNYERLNATTSSATLLDSSGDTHMYTWTGSGYKPPVNEDGQLTRNADGTFTLLDTDGKTYNFNVNGELGKVTMPTDDRKPAALEYTYNNGRIEKIADGVDTSRYAAVYYYGDGQGKCNTNPAGFDNESWLTTNGNNKFYLCALVTNDNRKTEFLYSQGNLARVAKLAPSTIGNAEATDYQYDSLGRIVAIRDSLANDAVAASIRTNDTSVLTELTYDNLGRATAVKAPAASAGATRQEQTIEYLPYAMPFVRNIKTTGYVDRWVTTGSAPAGYTPEAHISASLLLQQLPGTHALYGCLNGGWDQMVSPDANCEGQQKVGFIGYVYDNPQPDGLTIPVRRCVIGADHFMSHTDNCEGLTTENILGYAIAGNTVYGQTKQHITGDTEPNGYTRKIEWDGTFRTVRDTDVTGKSTYQQWHEVKDLLLSTTDATQLRSTTIYDANDMPIDSYGPAPTAWFDLTGNPYLGRNGYNANYNKPKNVAPNDFTAQVPRTSSAYDEGINGPAVAYFNYKATNKTLLGAPKLHTTGINPNPATFQRSWGTAIPITPDAGMDGWGLMATGKLTVPNTGNYTFRTWHDDGVRLSIDDKLVINDWNPGANRANDGTIALEANKPYRFKLDYFDADKNAVNLDVYMHYNGGPVAGDNNFGTQLKPDYNLQTSQTVYGAPTSNGATANLTSKTNYGTNPELGLAQSVTTAFGTPEALTATSSYLDPSTNQQDAYNRQTASSLPGGETTKYTYYGATESVTDDATRCNSGKTYKQGGMLRLKTEPDPDGTGPQAGRTVETIYDDAGKVVATRYNSDPWTCTTYDGRERVLTTSVPAYNGQPARTITNVYAVGGNPLITSSSDTVNGTVQTITVETDLLGRNVKYTDASGNETTSAYDTKGHLVMRVSPLGTEEFTYDSVDRLVSQKLDNTTYATITYDQYSRITSIDYPGSQKLTLTREPDGTGTGGLYGLGRVVGRSYTLPTGQTTTSLSDLVTRAVTGDITSGTELGQTKSYSYDTAGRLVSATVAGNSFTYSYGTQDASCTGKPGIPAGTDLANAGRSSNRTSQTITTPTINGVAGSTTTTTYCYDQADHLIASSNPIYDTATYDSHGNTTKLGNTTGTNTETLFDYDASDRTRQITQNKAGQPSRAVFYYRDVQGRLKTRNVQVNWQNQSTQHYGYTASGDSPDFVRDNSWNITEKYLTLPGDVLLTIRPTESDAAKQKTYSLPNVHGDIFATTNTNGILTSTTQTGPFGEVLSASTVTIAAGTGTTPNNTKAPNNAVASGGTFAYVGQHEKLTESDLLLNPMQMGSRTYLPGLGRFTSVDPVQGGTPNPYVYPDDPVNDFDLDGTFSLKVLGRMAMKAANIGSFVPGPVGMIASGVLVSSALARGDKAGAMFAAAGMIPGGKAIASTGKLASKLGKAGEVAVARMTGLVKNTTAYQIKGTSRRIPDFVSRSAFHEVKNTARLSLTKQVRETQAIAQHLNKSYFLWTRKNTRMSGPLRKQIQAGNIRHRTLPW